MAQNTGSHSPTLGPKARAALPSFESFLHKVGFKRINGAIYGLLVLSEGALSQEQIESELNLSQSAISQSLKTLTHYGAIDICEAREIGLKRVKTYSAKTDSLAIVATIFRKREQETVQEFKHMAEMLLAREKGADTVVGRRLRSIIATCEVAEAVMDFVMKLAASHVNLDYGKIIKKLPGAFDLLLRTAAPIGEVAQGLRGKLLKVFDQAPPKYDELSPSKEGPQ